MSSSKPVKPERVVPVRPLPMCSNSFSASTPASTSSTKVPLNRSGKIETPQPMPFFGGTIVFLPSPPSPSPSQSDHQHGKHAGRRTSLILPSSIPTPVPSPPLSTTTSRSAASNGVRHSSRPFEIKCHARARIPTPHGHVFLHLYKSNQDAKEHLAIVFDPLQMGPDGGSEGEGEDEEESKEHIRSKSLDAQWHGGETDMERLIRGAYVGRLREGGGKPSNPSTSTPTLRPSRSNLASNGTTTAAEPTPVQAPLVRIHSECFTGETLGSQRCDCGEQLDESLRLISLPTRSRPNDPTSDWIPGRGVIVYLRQEGRGIGLLSKLLAYNLQDMGHDTVSANLALGHGADERTYDLAAGILADLGLGGPEGETIRLMTNNPDKVAGLEAEGVRIKERVSMIPRSWESYPHSKPDGFPLTRPPSLAGTPPPLSLGTSLGGVFHPEVRAKEKEDWLARKGGVGMIGGSETRSVELDRYLRTKVERMGHILDLPKSTERAIRRER
ncbi:Bifunctional GTP cyclohydrolase II/3,4-dihydroxy-2butanone-4-phosphate synthase [Phaffia rhodozyma]|uniref:GTP cyclohydrolase II n=1 Tax=Phaffia rhodozyma TaxID=264483 RepID=A0A0F7SVD3_PHARH|nr:Bifunctional GTP cyclohydrolase II/3,4-dihydroxy-2butanone-4-phosphate synthase [Phaffia rhodozyma]